MEEERAADRTIAHIPHLLLELFLLIFAAIFILNFLNQLLCSFRYEYYASARMVSSL